MTASALIAAGRSAATAPRLQTLEFTAFTCRIKLATMERSRSLDLVRRTLEDWGRRFSRFRTDSELNRFNRAAGTWVAVSEDLYHLLDHSLAAAHDSGGLFNVCVPFEEPDRPAPSPPLDTVLELRPGRARLCRGLTIDFGGIAKGLWADRLVEMLGSDAACSIGGDLACRGPGPLGAGWPVMLPNGETVHLRDGAVATSGVGRRRRGAGHHIIDPRTGRSATAAHRLVCVVTSECATAEWLATSLVIGGTGAIKNFARTPLITRIITSGNGAQ